MADGVHPVVDLDEPAVGDPMGDRRRGDLELQQLLTGHVAELPIRDLRDLYSYEAVA
jgi:hypothetical protein